MSGLIKRRVTILSGTANSNIIAGEPFETLTRPAVVTLLINQEIVLASDIEVEFLIGNVSAASLLRPNVAGAAGVINRDADKLPGAVGQIGDRITIRAREITAIVNADGILNFQLEISDLG